MQHERFFSSLSRPDRAQVTALVPAEALRIHPEPILRMRAALGEQAAGVLVRQLRDDLTHRLGRVRLLHAASDFADIVKEGRAIAGMARSLGLGDLALAAEYVMDCAGRADPAALAATVGRLVRLGQTATLHFTRSGR